MERVAVLDLLPGAVVHPHRPELDLDRLAEPQHDLVRRRVELRAALGRRVLEQRMCRGGRGDGDRDQRGQRDGQDRAAHHQASASAAGCSAATRRR